MIPKEGYLNLLEFIKSKFVLIIIVIAFIGAGVFYFFSKNEEKQAKPNSEKSSLSTETKSPYSYPSASSALNACFPTDNQPDNSAVTNTKNPNTCPATGGISYGGGSGSNGANGANGSSGSNGSSGANGNNGRDGTNGTNGKDGIAGANGSNGATGPQGPAGPAGPAGPQGPAGDDGNTIYEDDLYRYWWNYAYSSGDWDEPKWLNTFGFDGAYPLPSGGYHYIDYANVTCGGTGHQIHVGINHGIFTLTGGLSADSFGINNNSVFNLSGSLNADVAYVENNTTLNLSGSINAGLFSLYEASVIQTGGSITGNINTYGTSGSHSHINQSGGTINMTGGNVSYWTDYNLSDGTLNVTAGSFGATVINSGGAVNVGGTTSFFRGVTQSSGSITLTTTNDISSYITLNGGTASLGTTPFGGLVWNDGTFSYSGNDMNFDFSIAMVPGKTMSYTLGSGQTLNGDLNLAVDGSTVNFTIDGIINGDVDASLGGDGDVSVANVIMNVGSAINGDVIIGDGGAATMTQYGGDIIADYFAIGNWGGDTNAATAYYFNGGTITSTGGFDISAGAPATFIQQPGTTITVDGELYVGMWTDDADAVFTQVGGDNEFTGEVYIAAGSNLGNDATYNIKTGSFAADYLWVDVWGKIGNANFIQDNGTVNIASVTDISLYGINSVDVASAIYTLNNGIFNSGLLTIYDGGIMNQYGGVATVGDFKLGEYDYEGIAGVYNMYDGELHTTNLSTRTIGENTDGIFNQYGGDTVDDGNLIIGYAAGVNGLYNMEDGTVTAGGNIILGNEGTGEFDQYAGTVVAENIEIGKESTGQGRYRLFSGIVNRSLTTEGIIVGVEGQGHFFQYGGNVKVTGKAAGTNRILVAQLGASTGTYHLSGGNLKADQIDFYGGAASNFNMTGGTLMVDKFGDSDLSHNQDLVQEGGSIAPGDTTDGSDPIPVADIGKTTIYGNYTQSAGNIIFDINLGATGLPIMNPQAGVDYDQVYVQDDYLYEGGAFEIRFTGDITNLSADNTYDLLRGSDITNDQTYWQQLFTYMYNGGSYSGVPIGWAVEKVAGGSELLQLKYKGTHGDAVSLSITPAGPVNMGVGGTQDFTAIAHDADDLTWDVTTEVTWHENDPTGSFSSNTYTGGTVGSWTVYATLDTLESNHVTVNVTHGDAVSLAITPVGPVNMTTDDTQDFIATATDADDNTWDVTGISTWHENDPNPAGSNFTSNTYNAGAVGSWTIYATLDALTSNYVTVNVSHGTIVTLGITPVGPLDMTPTDIQDFIATAYDSDGNGWNVTGIVAWHEDDPTGSFTSNTYTAGTVGTWDIYATLNPTSNHVVVNVTSGGAPTGGGSATADFNVDVDITSESSLSCASGVTNVHMLPDIGGVVGGVATGTTYCTVISSNGYDLYIRDQAHTTASGYAGNLRRANTGTTKYQLFKAYDGNSATPSSPQAWSVADNAEFGYNASGDNVVAAFGGAWTNFAPLYSSDANSNGFKVATTVNPSGGAGDVINFNFKAEFAPDADDSSGPDHLEEGQQEYTESYITTVRVTVVPL